MLGGFLLPSETGLTVREEELAGALSGAKLTLQIFLGSLFIEKILYINDGVSFFPREAQAVRRNPRLRRPPRS